MCFRPATVQQDKKCPLCSNSNVMDAKVCTACGAELPSAPVVSAPVQAGNRMPGAFGDSGAAGGGFQPRIPQAPAPARVPSKPNADRSAVSKGES